MRLADLTIRNFRGFGGAGERIALDRDLVLIFGPNGFGKTSIAEAVEWLFYGSTKRRLIGESYSKAEYAGTYANAHQGQPVQVDATVILEGREYRLTRRLADGSRVEASETFIDGARGNFASIGLRAAEAHYPVVAQHGLQTFIHSKPKDRRDAIGAALGLDELTTLKSSLEGARASFQRSPPAGVVQARKELSANVATLALLPATAALAKRWQKTPMQIVIDKDLEALLTASTALTGAAASTAEDALAALRVRRSEASKAIFDAAKIALAATIERDSDAATSARDQAKRAGEDFETALAGAIAALAAVYSAALLGFWRDGLAISPAGETCPMCEAATLTGTRRSELEKRIEGGAAAVATDQTFVTKTESAATDYASLKTATGRCVPKGVSDEDRIFLRTLLRDASAQLEAFLADHDQLADRRRGLDQAVEAAAGMLRDARTNLQDGAKAPQLHAGAIASRKAVVTAADDFMAALVAYREGWPAFERILEAHIASEQAVLRIDAVGKTLRLVPSMSTLIRYDTILEESQALIRNVEATLKAKQTALLETRGGEVKALYDLLNPRADVTFNGMEPGTDQMKLHATSYGVRMPAAANLSECQLNCLGLSVWLMQATTAGSPFGFVILDDPVQSMDDDHAEAFLAGMIPHLMDTAGKQIILLSHVLRITDRLRGLHLDRSLRHYHLDNYLQSGPIVIEQTRIARQLAHIKACAKGNDENRGLAVDRLRVLIETLIRELHLKRTGAPLASAYDNASPGALLAAFRAIEGTTPQEHSALSDSVGFCDPAHHTEVGYTTPLSTAINPHIDRVERLLKHFGMLS